MPVLSKPTTSQGQNGFQTNSNGINPASKSESGSQIYGEEGATKNANKKPVNQIKAELMTATF